MASNQELDAKNDQFAEENKAQVNNVLVGLARSKVSRINAIAATRTISACIRPLRKG